MIFTLQGIKIKLKASSTWGFSRTSGCPGDLVKVHLQPQYSITDTIQGGIIFGPMITCKVNS